MSLNPPFAEIADPRGVLQAIELAQVPFQVRRVFLVAGPPDGACRGDHVVPCHEWLVLLRGTVDVHLTDVSDGTSTEHFLSQPGDSLELPQGMFVRYHLADEHSQIIVFADAPYDGAGCS